jgi:hypothetical protein
MPYKTTKKDSIPTPNPSPARGVYGFALYIVSWILFLIYLFWAIVPSQYLEALHLTFLPSKYWAVAIPFLLPVLLFLFVFLQFIHNLINFDGIFSNVGVLSNDFIDEAPLIDSNTTEINEQSIAEDNGTSKATKISTKSRVTQTRKTNRSS